MESPESSYSCWRWVLKGMKIEISLLTSEDNPSTADAHTQKKQCINTEPQSENKQAHTQIYSKCDLNLIIF